MTIPRHITIDTWDRHMNGAYGLIVEHAGQAPILLECEGCDSSMRNIKAIVDRMSARRWCIVRLVPVEGNELLAMDFERLQYFNKETTE